jgi:hypothetical protein
LVLLLERARRQIELEEKKCLSKYSKREGRKKGEAFPTTN